MFEPYLKSFYIRSTDPTQIKVLKVRLGQSGGVSLPHIPAPHSTQTHSATQSGHGGGSCFWGCQRSHGRGEMVLCILNEF